MSLIKKQQRGSTLIEMAMVLVIIGLLIGAAAYGYSYYKKQKANNEAAAYTRVIQNLQEKYRSQVNTAAVTTTNAIAGNVFDKGLNVTSATTVNNNYDGAVTIAPATIVAANDGFLLTSAGIDDIGCEKIPLLVEDNVVKIDVGATNVKANAASTVAPATLDAACTGDANTLKLTFSKNG